MGLLDKVKSQAEQTAAKAREGVEEVQAKRELNQAYTELGRKAFELVARGEIAHAELGSTVDHIKQLNSRLEEQPKPDPAAA